MSNNSTRANSPVITSTVVKPTKKTTGSAESDSNDTTTNPAKDTTNENATDDKNVAATKQSAATAKKPLRPNQLLVKNVSLSSVVIAYRLHAQTAHTQTLAILTC